MEQLSYARAELKDKVELREGDPQLESLIRACDARHVPAALRFQAQREVNWMYNASPE